MLLTRFQRGGDSKLLIFDPGTNGDMAPAVEITTGLSEPQQVALSGAANIYVTNRSANPSITVYAAGPTGDVAPMRTITSSDMVGPFGVAAVVKDLTQPKLPHNALRWVCNILMCSPHRTMPKTPRRRLSRPPVLSPSALHVSRVFNPVCDTEVLNIVSPS